MLKERTFCTPTLLARDAGAAVALGVLVRLFLLPNMSCASFFGSVPSISWASFALRSCRLACRAVSKEATACAFFLSTIVLLRRMRR